MKIWDGEDALNPVEEFMLDWACIPEYQRCEASLSPDDCDIDAFDRLRNIRERISEFVTSANNLVICGKNLGCGKTEWALKMLLTYIEQSVPRFRYLDEQEVDSGAINACVFCQTVPFLVEMKQFGSNKKSLKMYERLSTTELAVFDDISAVPMSNYDYNILYALVEKRLFAGLSTIYTTNATSKEELEKEIGPRLAERIWKTSKIIELKGRGYRGV